MTVPYLMASLVDDGIEKSDMRHILIVGGIMFIAALVGLLQDLWVASTEPKLPRDLPKI